MKKAGLAALPFTRQCKDTLEVWAPRRTGEWAKDCKAGRRYADAAIAYVQTSGFTPLVGRIVQAITASGKYGGVEAGFFTRLASVAAN